MATASTATATTMTTVKKPGPPVPPRPQHATANGGVFRNQRGEAAANRVTTPTTPTSPTTPNGTKFPLEHPVIQKKPSNLAALSAAGGRTIIYKSPTMKQPAGECPVTAPRAVNGVAPRPPLKLRKAPDVPTTKPRVLDKDTLGSEAHGKANQSTDNGIVIVQSSHTVNLNRHNSMGSPKPPNMVHKETRLSLGRADFERVGKIQLDQLQPGQPLPKPRKIVKMPVATMDVDEENPRSPTHTSGISLFRRSKTTLDNIASRANVTTISTAAPTPNGFLSGKTVEIKNNLKNAAERLFSEIIVNQQKQTSAEPVATIITKHERAVQHQAFQQQQQQQHQRIRQSTNGQTVTIISSSSATKQETSNTTRININSTLASPLSPSPSTNSTVSTEKKTAFHEILISELAAMRAKSISMEDLHTRDTLSVFTNGNAAPTKKSFNSATSKKSPIKSTHHRCDSVENLEHYYDDVDEDNIEDADEGDEDELNKTPKVSANNSPRKRCPSGCSSDSSPYGTERSARIRTSDWIEVGDNGKQVTLTSCHISLEDSGLEDEERLDDMSSSGVGDSWDSVKEAENEKRCRSVKRAMSISDLPPLPKSLSNFNKILESDSGLISDADNTAENNNLNNNNNDNSKLNCEKDNVNNKSNNSNNNNNNSNFKNGDNENGNDKSALQATTNGNENEKADMSKTTTTTTTMATATSATATQATLTTTTTTAATATTGSTLDTQLATLKKEMYGLRQLDLSLLTQLWVLNDTIQEFRTMLQEQEQDADQESYSPHSPTPSSYDSVSSEGEEDHEHVNGRNHAGAAPKIITTQPKLMKTTSTDAADAKALNANTPLLTSTARKGSPAFLSREQQPHQAPLERQMEQLRISALPAKPVDLKPVPRMRSAPPPPPANRKVGTPPRAT